MLRRKLFPPRRPASSRRSRSARLSGILLVVLGLTLTLVPSALASIVVPLRNVAVFIQTTGPLAELGIGDYRTNDPVSVSAVPGRDPAGAGDRSVHRIELLIPCLPNLDYTVELFDPAVEPGSEAIDEPRDDNNLDTTDPQWFDNTHFRLFAPNGTLLQETTYTPGTSNDAWTLFATITIDGNPQRGVSCGSYILQTDTGNGDPYTVGLNNDDNAWQLRLDGVGFDAFTGPDGLPGTGDQAQVGILEVSYQHRAADCQDFYWFADDDEVEMYMLNFDMDDSASYGAAIVCYFAPGVTGDCSSGYPGSPVIMGTRSGNTTWNDVVDQSAQRHVRPAFSDMQPFDGVSDFDGDAITNPAAGLWRGQLCVDRGNQYSFEVPGHRLFIEPPDLPELTIVKDDGVEVVNSPGSTTYNVTITNVGTGAALPLPGGEPELVDQLPAGMTFQSCTVNAPLIGTCAENPGGSGRVEFQLDGHTDFNDIFLPGTGSGNLNSATVTITAGVNAGLADGTQLENVASVDFTDAFQNNYEPVSDNDIDTVTNEPVADLSLVKSVDRTTASQGDTVVFTIQVTNSGPNATTGVTVTDNTLTNASAEFTNLTLPAGSPSQGSYDFDTGVWTVGDLAVGQTETLTIQATIAVDPPVTNIAQVTNSDLPDPDSTPNNNVATEDDQSSVTINPPGSPPPGPTAVPPLAEGTGVATPVLRKIVSPENAAVGDTVLWTVLVSNPENVPTGNVTVTDTIPAMFGVVRVTSSRGTVTVTGNSFSVNIGVMQPGEEVTISVESVANVLAVPPQTCNTAFVGSVASNEVCVNIFPAELAAFGGDSPLTTALRAWWVWSLVGVALTLGGWLLLRRVGRQAAEPGIEG